MVNIAETNDAVTVLCQQLDRWRLRFADAVRGAIRGEWRTTDKARLILRPLRIVVSDFNSAPLSQIDVVQCQTIDGYPGVRRIIVILPKIVSEMALSTRKPERALK